MARQFDSQLLFIYIEVSPVARHLCYQRENKQKN
jgi:hypothetical protein